MISFDAETVIGGTTWSDAGGATTWSAVGSDHEFGTDSTPEVIRGSLGCASFIFSFNWRLAWRLAAFCAFAIAFWRCFICFWT